MEKSIDKGKRVDSEQSLESQLKYNLVYGEQVETQFVLVLMIFLYFNNLWSFKILSVLSLIEEINLKN